MNALRRRGYWAGVALASPFLAQFVSWKFAAVLLVPFIASVIITRPRPVRLPPVLMLAVLLAIVHALGLYFTDTPYAYQVFKDLCIFAILLGIFVLAGEDATDGLFAVVVPLGVVTAVLGLVKMAMLDRGYLVGPLLDAMTDSGTCAVYPSGTSPLCVDYNVLGLLWLLAIIGAMKSRWWLAAAPLLAAGMLLGSRRFILVAPLLPFAWLMLERKRALLKVLAVAVVAFVLSLAVADSEQFEKHKAGDLPWSVVDWTGVHPIDMDGSQGPGRTYAGVVLGTMNSDTGYGSAGRLSIWKFGLQDLHVTGSGFEYHTDFSCEFVKCKSFYYPHLPIMSEWLIGGVVTALVAVGFYVGLLWAAWKRRTKIAAAALLVTMPFALISGDTVFSLPQMIAVAMVVLLLPPTAPQTHPVTQEPAR